MDKNPPDAWAKHPSSLRLLIPLIVMVAMLLIAAAARFHLLDAQSLWYDEGVSFAHSQRNLFQIIPLLQDNVHVPGYFWLLSLWEDFTGSSEFALRYLSALFSLISVALTYALGKRLYSPAAGFAAAGIVAFNTFSIYYAQETRMYAMLSALAVSSMLIFVVLLYRLRHHPLGAIHKPPLRFALLLALINTIGIYTHYSYALLMLTQGILVLLWMLTDGYHAVYDKEPHRFAIIKRTLIAFSGASVLTIALFAPWLPTAIRQVSAQPNIAESLPTPEMLRILQGYFSFGITFEQNMGAMGVAIYFFLLFGLLLLPTVKRPRGWWRMLLPVIWVLLSAGIYLWLELGTRYLRFLLPLQIAFALWLGRGIWVLWHMQTRDQSTVIRYLPRFAAVTTTLLLLVSLSNGWTFLYHDPAYQRDNYRGLLNDLASIAGDGDALVLGASGLSEIVGYYDDSGLPVYPLPTTNDDDQTRAETRALIQQYDTLYAIFYGTAERDPNGIIADTLNNEAYPIGDVWYGDVRLLGFATPAEFDDLRQVDVMFGDAITLQTIGLSDTRFRAGDVVQVRLEWVTSALLETRYKVFIQLLNSDGVLMAQRDSEPGGGLQITTQWEPGETVLDNHALVLSPDLPTGEYTLITGVYDLNNPAARLPVGDSDFYELGVIQVSD